MGGLSGMNLRSVQTGKMALLSRGAAAVGERGGVGSVHWYCARPGGAAHAARARAGGEFCKVQNRSVAMLPWRQWPLSGGRLHFQVSMRVSGVGQAAQRAPRVRARADGEFCILQKRKVAMLPWKQKWPLQRLRIGFPS